MSQDLRSRGGELLKAGDVEGAAAVLKEATVEDPTDMMAWQMLGAALGGSGRAEEAVDAFQKAVGLQPSSARAQFNLAVALLKIDRTADAKVHLERAVALDPSHEQAKARLTELGGGVPPPKPAAGPPTPVARPAAPTPAPAPLGGLGAVGASPAPSSQGGGLAPIGGLSALGGGLSAVGAPPPPAASAPGGMPSMATVGAGAPALSPPNLGGGGQTPGSTTIPPATPSAPPMAAAPGGYRPPTAAYAAAPTSGNFIADGTRQMGFDSVRNLQGDWDRAMKGWNWGAFTFGPLWLWVHGLRSFAIIAFVLFWLLEIVLSLSLGMLTGLAVVNILSILFQFFLGLAGNQLGTQERTWNDADEFMETQRAWMWWSIPFGLVRIWYISSTIVMIVLALGAK